MKYYKNTQGGVYAYEQSDIETAGRITDLEGQLAVLQQWLSDTPEPPKAEVEADGTVVEDKHANARAEYKQKQTEAEDIQAQIDGILPVFFDIRDKLKSMSELTGAELDVHLNPVPTTEQLAAQARAKRDSLLNDLEPQLLRYERQEKLGIETTDTELWYLSALQYAQDLRDVPQQAGFPESVEWPEVPV